MMSEFAMGRRTGKNVYGTMRELAPHSKWSYFSIITILSVSTILTCYSTVAGWTLEYIRLSAIGIFNGKSSEEVINIFNTFTSDSIAPVLCQIVFLVLTGAIVIAGIKNGIERYTKLMMPVLVLIIVFMCVRSLTLNEKSIDGLVFLFKPDFSNITSKALLAAVGQAFFSLSVGIGCLMTYASYIRKGEKLQGMTAKVVLSDTVIAILAGVAILPATFAFGVNPTAGPGLAYLTLPQVFAQMPAGSLWGTLFFILLTVAALTSSISMLEVIVAYITQELNISRVKSVVLSISVIGIFGVLCTLSYGPLKDVMIFGRSIFDLLNFLSSDIMMPVGGIFICIFIGYVMDKKVLHDELSNQNSIRTYGFKTYIFLMRYIVPVGVTFVLLNSMGIF